MTAIPFDEHPSSQPSPAAWPDSPQEQMDDSDSKERAITKLLQHGVISHAFGQRLEYKVRTAMATRQTWQYRCCVLRHGKAINRAFFPITVDHTPPMRQIHPGPESTEAMRLNFAKEAVDVHFSRCAALREYLMLAAIYSQPASKSKRRYTFWVFLIGTAVLTAYGFWAYALRTDSGRLLGSAPLPVQGTADPVVDRGPTKAPRSVPLPASSGTARHGSSGEQASAPRITRLAETPKAVNLHDLLALENLPEKVDHAPPTPTPSVSPGSTASGVQAGDLLLLTGWLHRVSRAPDNTYRLQVSPSPRAEAPGLIAVVPPPDQATGLPDVQAQLQTARAFITQRLLRQQPSPRGSVIQKPIFVQLTGQLSYPDASLGEPSWGKRSRDVKARWEVRPVLEVRLATPAVPSDRSRPKSDSRRRDRE
jgi:hypothetical protein